jgi:aminopeptidase N
MKSLFLSLILLLMWGCATLPEQYRSVETGRPLKFDEIMSRIEDDRVVFVGESHESGRAHLVQLEIIRHLHERGKKVAVALEMFPAGMQGVLDRWNEGFIGENEFEAAYAGAWNEPYSYYKDIFRYTRKEKIPLVGINGETRQIVDVGVMGPEAISEQTLKELAYSPCAEEPEYRRLIGLFLKHGAPHAAGLPFFCDAQRFRDTVMAYHIAGALKGDVDVVVVLAGSAHALKAAVPGILRRFTGVPGSVIMSAAFGAIVGSLPDRETADYLWY